MHPVAPTRICSPCTFFEIDNNRADFALCTDRTPGSLATATYLSVRSIKKGQKEGLSRTKGVHGENAYLERREGGFMCRWKKHEMFITIERKVKAMQIVLQEQRASISMDWLKIAEQNTTITIWSTKDVRKKPYS